MASASPSMSTGLCRLAAAGRYLRNLETVVLESCASVRSAFSPASEAMMPGPPALVKIPTLGPCGSGCVASVRDSDINSSTEDARRAAACMQSAL